MAANQPLRVEVNQQDLYDVRSLLDGLSDAVPKVTRMAVNKTLTGVRTDATNEVSKVITPTKTRIRASISVKKMTTADDSAYVRCKGKQMPLIHFKARQTKKGVTVQVLKKGSRSLIKHAFIDDMRSGHKGVFVRTEWGGVRQPLRKSQDSYAWYGVLPHKYRLPIKQLFSFAVPDVLGHPPTIKAVLDLAGPRLKKEMDRALNYEISKLR
ncbi:MAG: phage tail protein [Deltaproteobacteria bacterium]|nr:phage tail protein [Deltaproteobacteria bacterium]